jgi:hypothetical protein
MMDTSNKIVEWKSSLTNLVMLGTMIKTFNRGEVRLHWKDTRDHASGILIFLMCYV